MIATATQTLPDGRRLRAVERGTYEYDTNAWVPGDEGMTLTDLDTGDALPPEAQDEEIVVEGQRWYLHEYLSACATWRIEEDR